MLFVPKSVYLNGKVRRSRKNLIFISQEFSKHQDSWTFFLILVKYDINHIIRECNLFLKISRDPKVNYFARYLNNTAPLELSYPEGSPTKFPFGIELIIVSIQVPIPSNYVSRTYPLLPCSCHNVTTKLHAFCEIPLNFQSHFWQIEFTLKWLTNYYESSWHFDCLPLYHQNRNIPDKVHQSHVLCPSGAKTGLFKAWWCHQMETFYALLALVRGIHRHRWIPHTKASDAELWCFLSSAPESTSE